MRAVLDTNIWVSAVINLYGAPARIRRAFRSGRFTLITSPPLMEEMADVLSRPRIASKFGLTANDIDELLTFIRERAESVEVPGNIRVCRDPDDDAVIETAVIGEADVIVSGDADLTENTAVVQYLAERDIEVWNVTRFIQALEEDTEDRSCCAVEVTGSRRAWQILERWEHYLPLFWKVAPHFALTEEGPQTIVQRHLTSLQESSRLAVRR